MFFLDTVLSQFTNDLYGCIWIMKVYFITNLTMINFVKKSKSMQYKAALEKPEKLREHLEQNYKKN